MSIYSFLTKNDSRVRFVTKILYLRFILFKILECINEFKNLKYILIDIVKY